MKWIFILTYCLSFGMHAQTADTVKQEVSSILFMDGIAHLGNGAVIPRAAIGIEGDKISLVMNAFDGRLDTTQFDTIIHVPKKHIYPGLIAPNSRLGLTEIDAVRATRDYREVGTLNPHVRALIAYNTESRVTSTVRTNGVLIAQVAPKGGLISGSSSIFNLNGWNWEDAVISADDGIHLNWPYDRYLNNLDEKKRKVRAEKLKSQKRELQTFFKEADAYRKKDFHMEKNLRYEAMKKVFDKKCKLYIHADYAEQINEALYFFDDYDFDLVLVGGAESWLVSDVIKDREVAVLLRKVHSLPMHEDEDIHLPFKLPFILHSKGIKVALQNSGDMEAMGTRNLPFYAGTAAAYGLSREEALKMICLNTAEILGIDGKVGSIEVGKQATLFISEGDALDMKSNDVIVALIDGQKIDLDNPQKQLYRKYSAKYRD